MRENVFDKLEFIQQLRRSRTKKPLHSSGWDCAGAFIQRISMISPMYILWAGSVP